MEVNSTKTEPYNGEESELRGGEGENIVHTNNTNVDISDVINTVMRTKLITDQEDGMTDEVCIIHKVLRHLVVCNRQAELGVPHSRIQVELD